MDSFTTKHQIKTIREVWEDGCWKYTTGEKVELLRMKIGPVLRFACTNNLTEAFFTVKMERIKPGTAASQRPAAPDDIKADKDIATNPRFPIQN